MREKGAVARERGLRSARTARARAPRARTRGARADRARLGRARSERARAEGSRGSGPVALALALGGLALGLLRIRPWSHLAVSRVSTSTSLTRFASTLSRRVGNPSAGAQPEQEESDWLCVGGTILPAHLSAASSRCARTPDSKNGAPARPRGVSRARARARRPRAVGARARRVGGDGVERERGRGRARRRQGARLVVIDRFLPASCAARWRDVLAASWAREAPCRGGGGGGGGGGGVCARAPPSWLCATSARPPRG